MVANESKYNYSIQIDHLKLHEKANIYCCMFKQPLNMHFILSEETRSKKALSELTELSLCNIPNLIVHQVYVICYFSIPLGHFELGTVA